MITVKHPDPECNRQQEAMLATCQQDMRRMHELLFTYGNIVYRYHHQAKAYQPNREDWKEWLEGLPDAVRSEMEAKGFEQGKTILSFTRYVMEKHDIGLEAYVQQHMEPQDYAEYLALSQNIYSLF